MSPRLAYSVLGPLEVRQDGRTISLGGRQQQAVLGVLLAARGQHVSIDRLLDEAWEEPPDTGRRAVAAHVSRLRSALGDSTTALRFEADGYVLRASPEDVDAERFRFLLQQSALEGPEVRARLLDEALDLWRGAPFDQVPGEGARAARRQLEELHTGAVLERARLHLQHGRASDAVAQLQPIVEQDLMREEPTRLLATALQRTGRGDEARALLAELREQLLEQYGLDPTPALDALEAAIAADLEPAPEVSAAPPPPPLPPLPLSSLIGRDTLLADVPRTRLLTLVGPAGVGKSRLALTIAHLDPCPIRGWLAVDLVDDAALLAQAVSEALAVTLQPGRAPVDGIAAALEQNEALLVLDNVDALRAPLGELVIRLLADCHGLRVVVTSREGLGIPGEQLVLVPPLLASDAMRLFFERAHDVQRGWTPGPADVEAVRRLCEEVDGLPLALELAAARTRTLDVLEVVESLRSQPQLLAQHGAGLAPHHRSLETALRWTYDLMTPLEQEQLRALAVFEGGFELSAAGALLDRAAPGAVAGLVRRSFLTVDRSTTDWRYVMLGPVRSFAAHRAEAAESRHWSRLHRRWVIALAAEAATELRGPVASTWLGRLDRERGNVRAAAKSALADGEAGLALALGADLAWYWYRRGLPAEGGLLLRSALETARPDQPERGRALLGLGLLQYLDGEVAAALATVREAVLLLHERGESAALSTALSTAGWLSALVGDLAGARRHADKALHVAGTAASRAEAMMVLGQLARFDRDVGDPEQLLRTSAELAEEAGDGWVAASSRWVAAKVALGDGRPHDALGHARAAAVLLIRDHDVPALLAVGLVAGAAVAGRGNTPDAQRLLSAVTSGGRRIGYDVERMDPLDSPALLRAIPGPPVEPREEDIVMVLKEVLELPE